MHKYIIILSLPFLLLVSSCESEITVKDLEHITPRLVLNTILTNYEDKTSVYVNQSRSVFDRTIEQQYNSGSSWSYGSYKLASLKDVSGSLKINEETYPLEYYEEEKNYGVRTCYQAGDRITLEATYKNEKVTSSLTFPTQPQYLSVDTVSVIKNIKGSSSPCLRYTVRIKDPGGVKNYYQLAVEKKYTRRSWFEEDDDKYEEWIDRQYYTDDPVLTNGFANNMEEEMDIEFEWVPENDFGIFTDNFFDGGEYTIWFYVRKDDIYSEDGTGVVNIYLHSITEELYYYFASVLKFRYFDETVNEPVVIYNNVEGGLGIAGAINRLHVCTHEVEYDYKYW